MRMAIGFVLTMEIIQVKSFQAHVLCPQPRTHGPVGWYEACAGGGVPVSGHRDGPAAWDSAINAAGRSP